MTVIGGQWLAYDLDGQLTNVAGSAAGIGAANGFYVYNAENKRTYSHVNGRDMLYKYDARGRLIMTYKIHDGEVVERIYLESGQALAKWTSGTTSALTYLHTDHLGTPVRGTHGMGTQDNAQGLTASVGDEVFADFTTPFGLAPTHAWWDDAASGFNPTTGQGSNCGVTGFTTHVRDCDTGLHYMQARYYEPGLGRFTSVDPVDFMTDGRTGMVNRYGYTLNDPVNMWDPDGRVTISVSVDGRGKIGSFVKNQYERISGNELIGSGAGGSVGIAISLPIGDSKLDAGVFVQNVATDVKSDTSTSEFPSLPAGSVGISASLEQGSVEDMAGSGYDIGASMNIGKSLSGAAVDGVSSLLPEGKAKNFVSGPVKDTAKSLLGLSVSAGVTHDGEGVTGVSVGAAKGINISVGADAVNTYVCSMRSGCN